MRVGFHSVYNPLDRDQFSSTPHYMLRALQEALGPDLRLLGGHRPPSRLRSAAARLPVVGGAFDPNRTAVSAAQVADLDWIISLASSAEVPRLAALGPARVAHVTDATPSFQREFGWRLDPGADERERRAVEAADAVIYSSRYMARRATRDFGALIEGKARTARFGVNMENLPTAPVTKPPLATLNLLFVGRPWAWKGGDVALDALDVLRDRGVAARLVVIGCEPPPRALGRADVEVHVFLSKNNPRERAQLAQAFRDAHLLILPTRLDCAPMVIAEANVHAAPVLVSDVGGVESLVERGVNGEMLPLSASGSDYADRIMALTAQEPAYRALSRSSFRHCQTKLTWRAWTREVLAILAARDREEPAPELPFALGA